MKRSLYSLLAVLLLLGSSFAATTLTGTVRDSSNLALKNGSVVFTSVGCSTIPPVITATGAAANPKTIRLSSLGNLSGYVSSISELSCPSGVGSPMYMLVAYRSTGTVAWTRYYNSINGSTWNIQTAIPAQAPSQPPTGGTTSGPVNWADVQNKPITFPSEWSLVLNKPTTYAPPLPTVSTIGGVFSDGPCGPNGAFGSINNATGKLNCVTISVEGGESGTKFGIPASDYVASGSEQSTTATTINGNAAVTLAAAADFVNGQGVKVYHGGAANTLATPGAPTATVLGTPGSTTFTYRVAAYDALGGVSAASPITTVSNAPASFSRANSIKLTIDVPSANTPAGYAIYRSISAGAYQLVGIVPTAPAKALPWVNGRPYHLGDLVSPRATPNGHYYKVTTAVATRAILVDDLVSSLTPGVHTITPKSMSGIAVGVKLYVSGNLAASKEEVTVTGTTGTSFTATFTKSHPRGFSIVANAAASEPSWCTTPGCTVTDNGIVYTEQPVAWFDYGTSAAYPVNFHRGIPTTPPSSSLNRDLVTTIASGAGTTSVVLSAAPAVSGSLLFEHDDTAALQAALTAAAAKTALQNVANDSAITFGTALFLPAGKYRVSSTLSAPKALLSDGMAVIEMTNPALDIFTASYNHVLEGVEFWGGKRQIVFTNGNSGGRFDLRNVKLYWATDTGVYVVGTQATANDNHMSTVVTYNKGQSSGLPHLLISTTDRFLLEDVDVHPIITNQDGDAAQMINYGGLEIRGGFFTPPPVVPGTRWVDNRWYFTAQGVRFGGENAGIPVVHTFHNYNYAEPGFATSTGGFGINIAYQGQKIIIRDSQVCAYAGAAPDGAVINLVESVPGYVHLSGNHCAPTVNTVRNLGNLDLESYFIDPNTNGFVGPDIVRWTFDNNDAANMMSSTQIPTALLPYVQGDGFYPVAAKPTSGIWKQGQVVINTGMTVSGVPSSWVNLTTGKAAPKWQGSTAYVVDQFVVPTTYNGKVYRVIAAGTTGTGEPAWSTATNSTVTSGSVVFAEAGAAARFVATGLLGDDNDNFNFYNRAMIGKSNGSTSYYGIEVAPGYTGWLVRGTTSSGTAIGTITIDDTNKRFRITAETGYDLLIESKGSKSVLASGRWDLNAASVLLSTHYGLLSAKPSSCTDGEIYVALDGTAGQNLWACIGGVYVQQNSAGPGGGYPSLTEEASRLLAAKPIVISDGKAGNFIFEVGNATCPTIGSGLVIGCYKNNQFEVSNNGDAFSKVLRAADSLDATKLAGLVPAASLPAPGDATLGGVRKKQCNITTEKLVAINADGSVDCATDQTGGGPATIPTVFEERVAKNWPSSNGYSGYGMYTNSLVGAGTNNTNQVPDNNRNWSQFWSTGANITSAGLYTNLHERTGKNLRARHTFTFNRTTEVRHWVGYADAINQSTLIASDDPGANLAALYYCNDSGTSCPVDRTNWQCVVKDGTTINIVDSGVPFSTNRTELEIREDVAAGAWRFTINGTERCAISTNIPPAGVNMKFVNLMNTFTAVDQRIWAEEIELRSDN